MFLLESLSLLALASTPALASQQAGQPASSGHALTTGPRWQIGDHQNDWVGGRVAVGDSGAFLLASRTEDEQGISMHATGAPDELFSVDAPGAYVQYVDVADRAPYAAALFVTDQDPGTRFDYEAVLEVYETFGDGTPLFTYTFPRTGYDSGGGVALSDDASTVLAWVYDGSNEELLIEAFDVFGQSISSGTLLVGRVSARTDRTLLSDDGERVLFAVGTTIFIYDVVNASLLHSRYHGPSYGGHAFSGDGKTYAWGDGDGYHVYQEQGGSWNEVATRDVWIGTFSSHCALDRNGSRLAFTAEYAYGFGVGLFDVPSDRTLFTDSLEAPGTTLGPIPSGVDIDDAGEVMAVCSWGDSMNAIPEVAVWDEAGNRTVEIDLPGSALSIDLSPDGEVWAVGSKAVHAELLGSGGSITCGDGDEQILHVLGVPDAGGSIQLQVADGWDRARVGIATQLGTSSTPIGDLDIDLNYLFRELRLVIPPGGLDQTLNVPPNPSLWGAAFHFQAIVRDTVGNQEITNKVSTRIIP